MTYKQVTYQLHSHVTGWKQQSTGLHPVGKYGIIIPRFSA